MSPDPVTFATLAATAYAAHTLADHVGGQTDRQAALKATAGRAAPVTSHQSPVTS
ncbi:hypothetical protein [Frankia sp. Cj3]|uniref:hypothetical protein n=1 Tax=Frankia sp. Cj3 TaxID=2880976 RepID=UPI001EF6CE5D|nr:hypothetical protein [Frankia sp. Cj3]